jgi:hypothetical protein
MFEESAATSLLDLGRRLLAFLPAKQQAKLGVSVVGAGVW